MRVLQGKGTDQQNRVVIINAAMAIQCVRDKAGLHECIDEATTSLMSGKALRSFQLLKANVGSGA
jgi:anthranilate phosphoribosyltransferase